MTEKKATLQSRVWKILSRRPIRDGMIEKIRAGNRTLSYLSWAHAHGEMMEALGPEGLVWEVTFQVWEDPRFAGEKVQFLDPASPSSRNVMRTRLPLGSVRTISSSATYSHSVRVPSGCWMLVSSKDLFVYV